MSENRHHALDWLRVIGIIGVFLFHSGAPFTPGPWHLNAPVVSPLITVTNTWLMLWVMPLFFFLSGAGTAFSLQRHSVRVFSARRVKRLLPPLLFGILIVVPPQVYIERLTYGRFDGSFLDFYPTYFDGWYLRIGEGGNFAWMGLHLWYLLFLLVLTFMALPVLLRIRRADLRGASDTLKGKLRSPGFVMLLAIPIAAIELILGNVGVGGWNMLTYPLFFTFGYVLYLKPDVNGILRKTTWPALMGGSVVGAALIYSLFSDGPVAYGLYAHPLQRIAHSISGWLWVLALVGVAYRFMAVRHEILPRLNEAVLPFYVLHQTFIVVIGYFIVSLESPPVIRFLLVSTVSFIAIMITYEVIIRRFTVTRFLFGMKIFRPSAPPPDPTESTSDRRPGSHAGRR